MNLAAQYQKAAQLLTEAQSEDNEARRLLLEKAINILQECVSHNPEEADCYHALAVCWYDHPQPSVERNENVEKYLRQALDLCPAHPFATIYLGYILFDERRYKEALAQFESVDEAYFEGIDQKWRVLKNRELILCCRLYLHSQEVSEKDVAVLCESYETTDSVDVPVPLEIVKCFSYLCEHQEGLTSKHRSMIERVVNMVKKIEFEKALSDDLAELEECVAVASNKSFERTAR